MKEIEIDIGQAAPEFGLKDQHGELVTLTKLRGKKVILSFHPLAWTPVCAKQMKDLEANYAEIESGGAIALGISVDSVPCKKVWAKDMRVHRTKLLSDFWPHGEVAQQFGILREREGFSERCVLILDSEGVVRFKKIYPLGEAPDVSEVLSALRTI